jgi:hypothetical protein
MQATLTIDDDLMEQARRFAEQRSITLDSLVAELLRKSLPRTISVRPDNGFPFFPRLPGEPIITDEDIRRAEEEDF